MTRQVQALIAGAYLADTNTRRVKRALSALFGGAVGKDVVSRTGTASQCFPSGDRFAMAQGATRPGRLEQARPGQGRRRGPDTGRNRRARAPGHAQNLLQQLDGLHLGRYRAGHLQHGIRLVGVLSSGHGVLPYTLCAVTEPASWAVASRADSCADQVSSAAQCNKAIPSTLEPLALGWGGILITAHDLSSLVRLRTQMTIQAAQGCLRQLADILTGGAAGRHEPSLLRGNPGPMA